MIAAEYADVHPLALYVYPQSFLNANKPIARLAQVKGLQLVTLTKADAEHGAALGRRSDQHQPGRCL